MKVILWIIRFTSWFVISLFVVSLQTNLINLPQLQELSGCRISNGQVFSGWVIVIISILFAFCISFTKEIWLAIKRMLLFYAIPFGVFYLIALLNWSIGLCGINNLPLINTTSPIFTLVFSIGYLFYCIVYGAEQLDMPSDGYQLQ
jgi:hypothetical protein